MTIVVGSRAQAVVDYLGAHGASFLDDIQSGTRLLETELEDALGELVASGLVSADGFGGLRALLAPAGKRTSARHRRGGRRSIYGIEDAGRWSLLPSATCASERVDARCRIATTAPDPLAIEHIAHALLRRYGVVCWRLLMHEAAWLPPWRELSRVYQRLEARGDVRGGRFVAGISGEQFALPEAIAALRRIRARPADDSWTTISGADPLNLVGSMIAGERVPRVFASRIAFRDGEPVAKSISGKIEMLRELGASEQQRALDCLSQIAPKVGARRARSRLPVNMVERA